MRALAAGRDVLAVMPTGYGKSAIYQVPALLLHRRQQRPAVVVSPLISLQEDQLDGLRDAAGPGGAVAVNSSHSAAEQERAWQAVEGGGAAFLFLAPEQLAKPSTVERIAALNIAAVRGGRGPLRLLLGPRFPARLPPSGRGPRAPGEPDHRSR